MNADRDSEKEEGALSGKECLYGRFANESGKTYFNMNWIWLKVFCKTSFLIIENRLKKCNRQFFIYFVYIYVYIDNIMPRGHIG